MTDAATQAIEELGRAFLSGDADRVLALFAEPGEIIYAGSEAGEVAFGKTALKALLEQLFARDERYCWRATSVGAVQDAGRVYVVADCELAVHRVEAEQFVGPAIELAPYRISGVLERHGSSWRWRFCQGSEPCGT